MKKRLISILLVLIMLGALLPQTSLFASAEVYSGTCGDNLTWTLDTKTGLLTITGSGAMTDWSSYSSVPWYSYRKSITAISLPEELTSIGGYALYDCSSLTSITIPDSVTSIGSCAFYNCSNLTSLTIPYNVKKINISTFRRCSSLLSITIPDNVISIGTYAFSDCSSLMSITLPASVQSIDQNAFDGCNKLSGVFISDIAAWCSITFRNNRANPLYYTSNLYVNGARAIELVIPDGVSRIGSYAFWGCSSLTSIKIPDSVKTIGDYAFYCCTNLTDVRVGGGVTRVGSYAFTHFLDLAHPWFADEVNVYISDLSSWCNIAFSNVYSNPLYGGCASNLYLNGTLITDIFIPEDVESINKNAFAGCTSVKNAIVPSNVKSIGQSSFYNCVFLSDLYIINPDCTIYDNSVTLGVAGTTTIYGYKDSTAETYAKKYKYTFVSLGQEDDPCANGHTWGSFVGIIQPTCTEPGSQTKTCTVCGATETEILAALGHNYVDGVCTRCGYNAITQITIKFVPSDGDTAEASLDFDYSDTFFAGSAYEYNHNLAKVSLGLTMATSCKNTDPNGVLHGDEFVKEALGKNGIGCDPKTFFSRKYDNNTATDDTCAYIFGTKYIPEQNAYLIPVVIRSANYGGEWASNVHVSEGHISTCSYGFWAAADAVYEDLQSYVAPLLPDNTSLNPGQVSPKIIYWVTGFSRGGAIANLLGARLTAASNGDGSSIFVYSFATPETVKSSAYVNYKNIHNIVSEIDVVPRVPLEAWSYTRYGTTHYLPCHTTRGVRYDTLLSGMQYEFNRLMTNNGCSYRNNPFYGQEIAIDLLLEYLTDLAPSTDEYEDGKLQALIRGFLIQKQGNCTLEDLIYFLLEGHETEAAMLVHIISSIDDATTMQKFGYYLLAVNEILAAMLTGEDTDAETVLKGRILKVLIELLIRYDARGYAGIVFGSDCFDNYACAVLMIEDLFDNGLHSALLMQHWPETYLAWLNSSNPNNLFSDCAYRRVSVKCPVDLVVYDSGDNVVARVQNDLVDTSVEHSLLVVVNGNGEKDIFLPEDEAYTVVITSRENGQLDIVETSFDLEHQLTGTACYFNLEMKENQTFLAEIDPDKEDIKVESLDNEIVADYSSEEPDKVQISITSVAPALTYGSGEYFVGETVCLAASDSHTYLFEGWYCNGNFITSEREIYFSAVDNREYTAVFHEHDWSEPEYVWADDYSTVTATRICKNDANHKETETVNTTSEVTKPATYDAEGEIVYTATFEKEAFVTQTKPVAIPKLDGSKPYEPCDGGEGCPGRVFTDMPAKGNWAHDAIDWAIVNKITAGTSATTFSPNKTCTRAEVVTFLWNAAGQPKVGGSVIAAVNPFSDVKSTDWYYNAVMWAVKRGVTCGTDATHFSPYKNCSRAEIVTFLRNASTNKEVTTSANPFKDVKASDWYYSSVLWAVERKITSGVDNTHFAPNKTCTRAEVVQFLYMSKQ